MVRHRGRFHLRLHLLEIAHLFQAALAPLDTDHVENLARGDGQLASDDLVFGLGISLDLDLLNARDALVFALDFVDQVDCAALRVRHFDRLDSHVDVTAASIEIPNIIDVGLELLRAEDRADAHLHAFAALVALADFLRRKELVAFELNRSHPVALPFRDDELDDHVLGVGYSNWTSLISKSM